MSATKECIIKQIETLLRQLNKIPETGRNPIAAVPPFDLVRVTKSKQAVDLCPNTIRAFAAKKNLRLYKRGGLTFFSRSELERFFKASPE